MFKAIGDRGGEVWCFGALGLLALKILRFPSLIFRVEGSGFRAQGFGALG